MEVLNCKPGPQGQMQTPANASDKSLIVRIGIHEAVVNMLPVSFKGLYPAWGRQVCWSGSIKCAWCAAGHHCRKCRELGHDSDSDRGSDVVLGTGIVSKLNIWMKAPLHFARPCRNRVHGSGPACYLSNSKLQGLQGKVPATTDILQLYVEGLAKSKLRQGCQCNCSHMAPIISLLQGMTCPLLQWIAQQQRVRGCLFSKWQEPRRTVSSTTVAF